jgi:hypothetical protein
VPVRPEEIPDGELRRVFVGVRDDLAFQPAQGGEGRIAATLRITGDEDAGAIAHHILDGLSRARSLVDALRTAKATRPPGVAQCVDPAAGLSDWGTARKTQWAGFPGRMRALSVAAPYAAPDLRAASTPSVQAHALRQRLEVPDRPAGGQRGCGGDDGVGVDAIVLVEVWD